MGEVFAGRFELISPVAAGGMGEVWTARDLRDDAVVAVKLLKQSDAGGLLRFMREQALRIHHPHVLTPLAWAGMDDRVLFSMPLARGGSVSGLTKAYGALPPRYVAELLRQLLDALAAVHAADIVHRDVKPANLLLDATGFERPQLLLSDFGVALPLDEPRLTAKAWVIGTPGYLAPEQAAGGDPAFEQDLYAVGKVGRELITGVRERRDDAPVAEPPAGTPSRLWQLVNDLTAADPRSRPTLAQAQAVLAAPELVWEPQERIVVPTLILPDGHLADELPTAVDPPAGPAPVAADPTRRTPRTAAPARAGSPQPSSSGPSFAPSAPSFAPSAPRSAPDAYDRPTAVAAQFAGAPTAVAPAWAPPRPPVSATPRPEHPARRRNRRQLPARLLPFALLGAGALCLLAAVGFAVLG